MLRRKLFALAVTAAISAAAVACAPARTPMTIATFAVGAERFHIVVRDAALLDQLRRWERGEPVPRIPNGRIARGAGVGDHNRPWSWHLDPDDIHLADVTIEICDATPGFVEQNLDDFMTIGRYCPWNAELVRVELWWVED
jgi:hypothetical protein